MDPRGIQRGPAFPNQGGNHPHSIGGEGVGFPQPAPPPMYNPAAPSYPTLNQGNQAARGRGNAPGAPLFEDLGSGGQFITQVADSPLTQIGIQYGGKMFDNTRQYVDQQFGHYLSRGVLKYYFNVNNSYVFNKIKLLLCPLLHRSWKRRIISSGSGDEFLAPRDDINAPDLYIPTMAFVTYVLLVAFVYGTKSQFTPELIGVTASTSLVLLTLEVLFVKAGFYVINAVNVSMIDLVAYCGYKYVSVVAFTLAGFLLKSTYVYYVGNLVLGVFMTIFMVRTLRVVLLSDSTTTQAGMHQIEDSTLRRNYLLLLVGVLQPILCYFLGVHV